MSAPLAQRFDDLWGSLSGIGRDPRSGGYHRFAWTAVDRQLRTWFAEQAERRGMAYEQDRNGNQWAWWGAAGAGAVVTGSHLDSVPNGGSYDGPLGVVSGFLAVDELTSKGVRPTRPVAVVNCTDEEGARFGVACMGSRLLTGVIDADTARGLRDTDGVTLAQAMLKADADPDAIGRDDEALSRIGAFIELHVEQGRGLADLDAPVGVATAIWPHGRWRCSFHGEANHAGTTRLVDRRDPMLPFAATVQAARQVADDLGALATFGRAGIVPNGTNAIASTVDAWLDLRAPDEATLAKAVAEVSATAHDAGAAHGVAVEVTRESYSPVVEFSENLRDRITGVLGDVPSLPTGAGHDAGILSAQVPTGMLFVRNPTGISHSPSEQAEASDCVAGARAGRRAGGPGMPVTAYLADHAWLGGEQTTPNVLLEVDGAHIVSVRADASPPEDAIRLRGVTIPGMANAHSHAFHRALRGRTHRNGGTFWTWRDDMYEVAARLTPDNYRALARAVYAEMALAGITCVGEFHYVHHDAGGKRYDDPNAMGQALIAAAAEAGIRITLLEACYLTGGVGQDLQGPQLRFGDVDATSWAERVSALDGAAHARIGAAIHSVRAVPPTDQQVVIDWANGSGARCTFTCRNSAVRTTPARRHTGGPRPSCSPSTAPSGLDPPPSTRPI